LAEETGSDGLNEDTFHQVSTVDALYCGHFEEDVALGEVLGEDTLGLGTVNGVDGELVIVDGEAYAVRGDGTVDELDDETRTPFVSVTEFAPDETHELEGVESFDDFEERTTELLPRTDHIYALRIEGEFDYLRTRSVEEQVKPYPTLEEVVGNERTFEFEGAEGTMSAFYIPEQFENVHPPGYHAHFVTADRDGGGHVYDFHADSLTVEVDRLSSVRVELAEREVDEYPPCE